MDEIFPITSDLIFCILVLKYPQNSTATSASSTLLAS